jgi:hypothetical protein
VNEAITGILEVLKKSSRGKPQQPALISSTVGSDLPTGTFCSCSRHFGSESVSKRHSFPQKRQSIPQAFGNARSTRWIPAFAGMTCEPQRPAWQMTPLPHRLEFILPTGHYGRRILGEDKFLRRLTYILLGVLLLQFSGLREVCFARPCASHDCCPAPKGKSLPSRSSLPDCCLAMALTLQSSVAEVATGADHSVTLQPIEMNPATDLVPPLVERRPERLTSSGLTLPPLTPLLQTCLLLI